jgi:hypothetical protein
MSFMHGLELRDGFEAYGAIAYFANDTRLLKIYWCNETGVRMERTTVVHLPDGGEVDEVTDYWEILQQGVRTTERIGRVSDGRKDVRLKDGRARETTIVHSCRICSWPTDTGCRSLAMLGSEPFSLIYGIFGGCSPEGEATKYVANQKYKMHKWRYTEISKQCAEAAEVCSDADQMYFTEYEELHNVPPPDEMRAPECSKQTTGGRLVLPNVPADAADWEHAKWVFKVSLFTGITLRDHLVHLHFLFSNNVVTAAREQLGSKKGSAGSDRGDSAIRRLLRPFTYRTVAINYVASKQLVEELGFLHRTTAFTVEGLHKGFQDCQKYWKHNHAMIYNIHKCAVTDPVSGKVTAKSCAGEEYYSQPQFRRLAENRDEGKGTYFPCGEDAVEFRKVVHTMVTDYVDIYYNSDASIRDSKRLKQFWNKLMNTDLNNDGKADEAVEFQAERTLRTRGQFCEYITEFIVAVTGHHALVGSVAEYLTDARLASGAISRGR